MWNREVQDIYIKARGKPDLLFEACYIRTIKKMHKILGLKDIFARLWRRFMKKQGMKQVFYWDSETIKR